jgi:hypothetical protein
VACGSPADLGAPWTEEVHAGALLPSISKLRSQMRDPDELRYGGADLQTRDSWRCCQQR